MVGRQPGSGPQRISIGNGCGHLGVVVHEIGMPYYNLKMARGREAGVLQGILVVAVPPGSPNPDPISRQKMLFSKPVFRREGGHKTHHTCSQTRQKLYHHY